MRKFLPHATRRRTTVAAAFTIALVAAGKSDAGIAAALGITRSTAHEYVESARRRLKSATRAQMVARACFFGLVSGA